MRRMDRYRDNNDDLPKRYVKNQELYQDVANNPKYTNITDVTNSNTFEINNLNNEKGTYSSREEYQQMRKYHNVEPVPRLKKELDDFNYLYKNDEKKVYDINSVLEEARKNRKIHDDMESKRKLKNTSYNILADLNKEELEKYREEKKNRVMSEEEEQFHDMVDTIASKTLAGEIDAATSINLLSDLMATSVMDKVDDEKNIGIGEEKEKSSEENTEQVLKKSSDQDKSSSEMSLDKTSLSVKDLSEIEKKNEELDNSDNKLTGADNDFYTRSMDLSDKDFDMDEEFKEKSMPIFLKILIFFLIIAIIAVAVYFIYLRLK